MAPGRRTSLQSHSSRCFPSPLTFQTKLILPTGTLFSLYPWCFVSQDANWVSLFQCRCWRWYPKASSAQPVRGVWVTWPEQPPAVLLVCGTLAVVAVALRLVEAGFAVHLKAVFGTLRWRSGTVISQITLACWHPANTSGLFELWVETQRLGCWCYFSETVVVYLFFSN